MRTVPCPAGDGTCTIPDPAVVVSADGLSLRPLSEVEHLIGVSDEADGGGAAVATMSAGLSRDQLRIVETEYSAEQIWQLAASDNEDTSELARSILGNQNGAVVIRCSCAHIYVLDT
jgi:hypothetical protein